VRERDPSEGPPGYTKLGEAVDVLTRDGRDGEIDNQVIAIVYQYAEWK
jgi:hypothetical protein